MRFLLMIFLLFVAAVVYHMVQEQKTPEEVVVIVMDSVKETYERVASRPATEKKKPEKLLRESLCKLLFEEKTCLEKQEFIIASAEKTEGQIFLAGFLLDHRKKLYSTRKVTRESWSDFIAVVPLVLDDYTVQEICVPGNVDSASSDWIRLYPPAKGKVSCSISKTELMNAVIREKPVAP